MLIEKLKFAAIAIALTGLGTSGLAASAQTDGGAIAPTETGQAERVLPEIIVRGGPAAWRRGLIAYYKGNYVEAERQFRSFRNALNQDLLDIGDLNPGSSLAQGDRRTINAMLIFENPNVRISGSPRYVDRRARAAGLAVVGVSNTENNFAQASYALGASLVKQGEFSEAKRYFSSALGRDRDLHDARLRLGLIALLEDNLPIAKRRLRELENYCQSYPCTGDSDLAISISTLRTAIEFYQAG